MIVCFCELIQQQFLLGRIFQNCFDYHINKLLKPDFVPEHFICSQRESCDVLTFQMLLFDQNCLRQSQSYFDSLYTILNKLNVLLLFLFGLRHIYERLKELSVQVKFIEPVFICH